MHVSSFQASVVHELRRPSVKVKAEDYSPDVFVHYLGAAPGSTNIVPTLRRLITEIAHYFQLDHIVAAQEYKNLVAQLETVLKEASEWSAQLVVVIDGVDQFEDTHQARTMQWLPEQLPSNVLLIVTVRNDSPCFKALQRHSAFRENFVVGSLQLLDKTDVARHMLSERGKQLDESAFGNQVRRHVVDSSNVGRSVLLCLCLCR